jgi:F420-0:gamma-glutamyl ligase-like protein
MTKYKVLPLTTKYWRPGQDYVQQIIRRIDGKIADNDIVVLSEKALSTARNNIIDETQAVPGSTARLVAAFWMRKVWGYLLGPFCHFRMKLISRIRQYPLEAGSRHKQVALEQAGFLQTLMFGSEGAIDGSNLPYSYVSLPLKKPDEIAETIRKRIQLFLKKRVAVMIVDTDKTYSFKSFHFTPRPSPIRGIHTCGGFIAYAVGQFLKLRKRATPLALAGRELNVEETLTIAQIANHSRGFGAGRTVWEMAERFNVALTDVSWEMLDRVKHKPIIIVRSNGEDGNGRQSTSSERLF